MKFLNMSDSYDLTKENIDKYVKETIGNYALGYNNDGFFVRYIGRSDTNLNERLKNYLKNPKEGCNKFKFFYAKSVKDAYLKECKNYHDFKPKLNDIHPDKPKGFDSLRCPVCDC